MIRLNVVEVMLEIWDVFAMVLGIVSGLQGSRLERAPTSLRSWLGVALHRRLIS